MRKCLFRFGSLAACAAVFGVVEIRAQFATSVISYNAGTGGASGFNQPTTALGAPSTFTNLMYFTKDRSTSPVDDVVAAGVIESSPSADIRFVGE